MDNAASHLTSSPFCHQEYERQAMRKAFAQYLGLLGKNNLLLNNTKQDM